MHSYFAKLAKDKNRSSIVLKLIAILKNVEHVKINLLNPLNRSCAHNMLKI